MSLNRGMEEEDVVDVSNGILLSQKKRKNGSLVVMSVDLESVIQSEVSQREKNKSCALVHIYGI